MEGLVNRNNYAYSGERFDERKNSNFWASLYNQQDIESLTPEQKKYIENMTGAEQHQSSRLDSYTGKNSAQQKVEELKRRQLERFEEIKNWKPGLFSNKPPEPINLEKDIETLIKTLEDNKKNVLIGDSLFTKTTDKPMTVYRKVNINPNTEWGKSVSDSLNRGEIIRDTNFLSTTTNKEIAGGHNFYPHHDKELTKILQIEVPAGTKYFVNPLSKAGKIDPNLGFNLPHQLKGLGYAEDEIIFPRDIGLQIDPSGNELAVHQKKGVYADNSSEKVKAHKARLVSPESEQPDRLTGEIDSQLKYLNQELKNINPKLVKGTEVAGKVANVAGKASIAFDPVEEVASQVLPRAASAAGLGAEVAMGAAMIPLAVGAFTQQAGDPMGDFKASFAPGEFEKWQKEQEELRKRQNASSVQSIIDRPYDPNQASSRRRQQ